jgi:hypothetical protein
MSHETKKDKPLSRRDALKTLAGIAGGVTLASLPSKWNTPVVEASTLPKHALQSNINNAAN